METHNPKQIIEQLQVILSNPAKKIGFLFGAGISAKDKNGQGLIETSQEMIKSVVGGFDGKIKAAIDQIRNEIENNNEKFNIETHFRHPENVKNFNF